MNHSACANTLRGCWGVSGLSFLLRLLLPSGQSTHKQVFIILFLLLVGPVQAIGTDKFAHFGTAFVLTDAGSALMEMKAGNSPTSRASLGIVPGILVMVAGDYKERHIDKRYDRKDMIANLSGVLFWLGGNMLLDWICPLKARGIVVAIAPVTQW